MESEPGTELSKEQKERNLKELERGLVLFKEESESLHEVVNLFQ